MYLSRLEDVKLLGQPLSPTKSFLAGTMAPLIPFCCFAKQ